VGEEGLNKGLVLLGNGLQCGSLLGRQSHLVLANKRSVVSLELGVRVQLAHEALVLQRVSAVSVNLGLLCLLGSQDGLDFVGAEQSVEVGVGDQRAGELVVLLVGRLLLVSSVDAVELLEGVLGPDAESANVASRCKLEEVQTSDIDCLNSGHVSEGLEQLASLGGGVDKQRTTALHVAAVSVLTVAGSDVSGFLSLLNIAVGSDVLQQGDGILGLDDIVESLRVDDEGDLGNLVHSVSSGQNQSGDGGTGQSRGDSVSALVAVGASVPSSPGLGGCKHSSSSAHVSESSLSGTVGTSSANSGNTSDGTTGSPRLSRCLVSSVLRHSIRLSSVLVQVLEHVLNHVGSDGSSEYCREGDVTGGLVACVYSYERSSGHCGMWD